MIGLMSGPSSKCWQTMLAIDIGPMIDRRSDDNCGPILACYIGPKIDPDDRLRITARVKPKTFLIHYVLLIHVNINIQLLQKKKKKKTFSVILTEVA